MNTFTWLLLGHLVGDWMLQNDWMAENKQRALFTAAGMLHFVIYTFSVATTLLLFTGTPLTAIQLLRFILIVFTTHWLIDALNLASRWATIIQQTDIAVVRIAVDQTFHLLVLAGLVEFLL